MKLKLKKPSAPAFQSELQELLKEYEDAEVAALKINKDNPAIFDRLAELEDVRETCKERMKRLVYVKKSAPSFLRGNKLWGAAAVGETLQIDITYKRRKDHYDPNKLPNHVLTMRGVVSEVDRVSIETVLATTKSDTTRAAIRKAQMKGDWMTPSLSVRRRKTDNEDE